MNEDFRTRVFTPLILPLGLFGAIAAFAWSLSRIFLALPALAATFVALLVAAYVLAIGALVSRMRNVTSRALGVSLALGIIGVVGAGAVANAVGMREVHPPTPEDEVVEDEIPNDVVEEVEIPDDAAIFVAVDIDYSEAPDSLPAGDVTFALVNEGALLHDVVLEEPGDELVVEAQGGETQLGETSLDAGETYTYYCSVPGHREAGMEGQFSVEG